MYKRISIFLFLVSVTVLALSSTVLLTPAFAEYELAKLLAADGAEPENFGYSVAVDGDFAVIGAWADDDNGDRSGSAYVYRDNGSSWIQMAKLLPGDGDTNDRFGWSVAISGDNVLIGARSVNDYGTGSGAAYVFRRDDNGTPADPGDDTWVEQQKLWASDPAGGDYFGWSVAILADNAVIGAFYDDDNGTSSGSAYVFRRDDQGTPLDPSDDTWVEHQKLLPSDGDEFDWFGCAVGLSGDNAVIGAYKDEDLGGGSGSAYIFRRDDSGTPLDPSDDLWGEQDKLLASDGAGGDYFGIAVAISGDNAIIGAPRNHDLGSYSGSAYVFRRDDSGTPLDPSDDTWIEQEKLLDYFGDNGDFFGQAVSISGDVLVSGSYLDDNRNPNAGSVSVFYRDDSGTPADPSDDLWTQEGRLLASDGADDDLLGWAVSISGATCVAGAYGDDDNGLDSGSAYVFDVVTLTLTSAGIPSGDEAQQITLLTSAPNPFNPLTTVDYYVPAAGLVRLAVYGVDGRLITRLVDEQQSPGRHSVQWAGRDRDGRRVSSGVYLVRLEFGDQVRSHKVMMVE